MAEKTAIGDQCWLWSAKGTKPEVLVITAHGAMTTDDFKVPDTRLLFYTPPAHTVIDPGLREICDNEIIAKEVFEAGTNCPDHTLSKYQGKHGGEAETYAAIERLVATKYFGTRPEPIDVLTVRARYTPKLVLASVTLSATLSRLWRMGYKYREVRCSFCRVTQAFGKDPSFSPYNIVSGKKPVYR
jgi:hypothetical protein